jgi:hypothetical protein
MSQEMRAVMAKNPELHKKFQRLADDTARIVSSKRQAGGNLWYKSTSAEHALQRGSSADQPSGDLPPSTSVEQAYRGLQAGTSAAQTTLQPNSSAAAVPQASGLAAQADAALQTGSSAEADAVLQPSNAAAPRTSAEAATALQAGNSAVPRSSEEAHAAPQAGSSAAQAVAASSLQRTHRKGRSIKQARPPSCGQRERRASRSR